MTLNASILMNEPVNVQGNLATHNRLWQRLSNGIARDVRFKLFTENDDSKEIRQFISAVFAVHHFADYDSAVQSWTTDFAVIASKQGELLSAAGYRRASTQQLASERYLTVPIEKLLPVSDQHPRGFQRDSIVEIAHLASVGDAAGQQIMFLLAQHLSKSGAAWIVATITAPLQGLLERYGLKPIVLASASITALPIDQWHLWGNYYDQDPRVVLISLSSINHLSME